jgi:hypothetical protein
MPMVRLFCFVYAALAGSASSAFFTVSAFSADVADGPSATTATSVSQRQGALAWQSDYARAMEVAARQRAYLVVQFYLPGRDEAWNRFENEVLSVPEITDRLASAVLVKVPLDARIRQNGDEVELLRSPAFAGMRGRPGLAIIDLVHENPEHYGRVVGTLPLRRWRLYAPSQVAGFLDSHTGNSTIAAAPTPALPPIAWETNYEKAMIAATRERKMALILFCQSEQCPLQQQLESQTLADPLVADRLENMVLVKLLTSAKVAVDGREIEILKHPAFAEMLGMPGIAVIDLAHDDPRVYGHVVSVFPFLGNRVYTPDQMRVILDLPPGTLTQRTLIYAVRTHPDHPASANGQIEQNLVREAESHSAYQAQIHLQGHHSWETRFHRINALLPGGRMAKEVCAESWPGQHLLEAAVECVRCWRYSEGHWSAVNGQQDFFGYDMKRGTNGIWYATGIFGR